MLRLEQEDGHLGAGDRSCPAVVAASAAARDAVVEELLDEGVEAVRLGHVRKSAIQAFLPMLRGTVRLEHLDVVESPGAKGPASWPSALSS